MILSDYNYFIKNMSFCVNDSDKTLKAGTQKAKKAAFLQRLLKNLPLSELCPVRKGFTHYIAKLNVSVVYAVKRDGFQL